MCKCQAVYLIFEQLLYLRQRHGSSLCSVNHMKRLLYRAGSKQNKHSLQIQSGVLPQAASAVGCRGRAVSTGGFTVAHYDSVALKHLQQKHTEEEMVNKCQNNISCLSI